jgi:hypothetical protein
VNGQEVILIDRDAPLSDQIDFLTAELAARQSENPQAHPDKATDR